MSRKLRLAALLAIILCPLLLRAQEPANEAGIAPDAAASKPQPEPIDKRAFGVLPNYRTADGTQPFVPIPNNKKLKIALKDSFDWPLYATGGFFAGLYQLQNQNPSFGQGMAGFARRYATSYSDQVIGNMMTEGFMPTMLHQDPRYFRRSTGSVKSRLGYALTRIFVCKDDTGKWKFNGSELLGNSAAVAISNAYYPDTRTVHENVEKLGLQLLTDAISQVAKEFWPDVKRRWQRKHNKGQEFNLPNP
jgi:hypothetical protein